MYVTGKGWVEAGDLAIGTSIVTRAGPPVVVQSVDWQRDETGKRPFTVYNLTVQGDHTYFAGDLDGGVWAHNETCGQAARALRNGASGVTVSTRADAEQILYNDYMRNGAYRNSTGSNPLGAEQLFGSDAHYHWDENVVWDEKGKRNVLQFHGLNNPDAYQPHLQIENGPFGTQRIFFGDPIE